MRKRFPAVLKAPCVAIIAATIGACSASVEQSGNQVVDSEGQPIAGAWVGQSDGNVHRSALTDANGVFSLASGLDPSQVEVRAPGWQGTRAVSSERAMNGEHVVLTVGYGGDHTVIKARTLGWPGKADIVKGYEKVLMVVVPMSDSDIKALVVHIKDLIWF